MEVRYLSGEMLITVECDMLRMNIIILRKTRYYTFGGYISSKQRKKVKMES